MTNNQHTKEPWVAEKNPDNNGWVVDAGRIRICDVYQILDVYSRDFGHDKFNADRIVACVNACEGINPEAVKELLEALKLVQDWADEQGIGFPVRLGIRAAIAKAKGE